MELQFNKKVIPCLHRVLRDTQVREQTQEVRLPDGMPDVGQVLTSWGQVVVRAKEWHSAGISVSGGVMVWVLYNPEDGSEARCVESWLPFQMKWDFPEPQKDGDICVRPILRSVDSRCISARKLMVRSVVELLAEAMVTDEAEIYFPEQLPEDVCVLKNSYPVQMPVEAGEKAFTLEDAVGLPEGQPQIEKLIRYHVMPQLTEQKILADKIVFRGNIILHILYRGTDGQLYCWDFDIPFSQFGELKKEYDSDGVAKICFAVTGLEVDKTENGSISFKVGLTGQYTIYGNTMIEVVEDAYSPVRQVSPQRESLYLPAVLDSMEQMMKAEQTVDADATYVADVAFYPGHLEMDMDEDGITTEVSGDFQILYYDENGSLQCVNSNWNDQMYTRASKEARVEGNVTAGAVRAAISGMNVRPQTDVYLDMMTWADTGIPMVTGLEMGEIAEPDPNRPSLILCRAGEDGLWTLAKRTGSTVDAIKKANNLEGEPDGKKILLIPVS